MAFTLRSIISFVSLLHIFSVATAEAATLPAGFSETLIAGSLASPTAMQFAPDGRLFVCEQTGRLRVIKNGALLSTPFVTLSVDSQGERGLLGVAFDPSFDSNGYIYLYYTTATSPVHNRISRFTANGDVAVPGSELVILDLENLSGATNHNGGAIHFGLDGTLYVAVGDNANGNNAPSFTSRFGKILRINADGSIPGDNPFQGSTAGVYRAIWARGLRNPFTFAFNSSGLMFINDVGQNTWEEINEGRAGADYGWPSTEGTTTNPNFDSPRYTYSHSSGGCAITGGAFYTPLAAQFPSDYAGDFFFADYCGGWIRRFDPASGGAPTDFASGIGSPVDLQVSDDGSLYYLARSGSNGGGVYRVIYGSPSPPAISTHPVNATISVGGSATFSVIATGTPPFTYRWQRNNVDIAGTAGAGSSYTISNATLNDNGATFRVRVTNAAGNALSNAATLTVSSTPNSPPVATITQPNVGALYNGGSVITYAGTGTDAQDGSLPASAFTWRIDFHHDSHTHPFLQPTTGATSGSVTIPTTGETSANVWYRIYLTVRDSRGLTHTVQRDVVPRKVRLTLNTEPAGLQVRLDGQPTATPVTVDAVVGIVRNLSAQAPQTAGSTTYDFTAWSDGGAATHDVTTPAVNSTYVASYRAVAAGPGSPPTPTLTAYTNGLSLDLSWTPAPGATSYILEAGSVANAKNLLNVEVGRITSIRQVAPAAGTYYVRVRSLGPGGASGPSNEVRLDLTGAAPCATPPPTPAGYTAQSADWTAWLSWSASPSATSYVLEAGRSPDQADLVSSDVGNVQSLTVTGPGGVYFTRVRAVNACGPSAPSTEVPITLGCTAAPSPTMLTITKANGFVTLSWVASVGAARYRAQVGTARGAANVFDGDLGNITSITADARGLVGTVYVRIFAANSCGVSATSNEVTLTLP